MTTLPEPGSSPARRPEPLLDVSVPHRAGAIVSEFISSIVGEAQTRASEIVSAAEEEAAPRRQSALELAGRVRAHQDAMAELLAGLRNDLRREVDVLYADPRIGGYAREPAQLAAPKGEPAEQEEALASDVTLTDTCEPPYEDASAEEIVDASVEEDTDAPPEEEAAPAAVQEVDGNAAAQDEPEAPADDDEHPDEATEVSEDEERLVAPGDDAAPAPAVGARAPSSRFERMTDEELARAHANAVKAATRDPDGEQAGAMRHLAEAALEEALRRPAFELEGPVKVTGRRRSPLSRRKRARKEALAELREACQRARRAS